VETTHLVQQTLDPGRASNRGRQGKSGLVGVDPAAIERFQIVGVAVDGSRLFQAHLEAQTLADEAASAGAQQVDVAPGSSLCAGNPPELVQGRGRGSAFAVANAYLVDRATDGHTSWTVAVDRRIIQVKVQRQVEMVFLEGLNLGPQIVQVQSSAGPVSGITGPEE